MGRPLVRAAQRACARTWVGRVQMKAVFMSGGEAGRLGDLERGTEQGTDA